MPDFPDVINYTTLRKTLRDEIFRVLTKKEMQGVFPNCISVGSPFIVHDPDTFQPKMLFTAWSDPSGLARQVWIADIDEDLRVSNMKKIADGGLFGVSGLNTCSAFWDDYNEQWIFACTAYGAPKQSYGYFIFFNKDWNVIDKQVIDFEQTIDTSKWTPNLSDAGIGLVPHYDKGLTLSCGYEYDRSLFYISDFTARPLPSPVRGLPLVLVDTSVYMPKNIGVYFYNSRDVHQLFVYNNQLIMLSETLANVGFWNIEVSFGPEKGWYKVAGTVMTGKFHLPSAIIWKHSYPNYTDAIPSLFMHPHYTGILGIPLLFYKPNIFWNTGGARTYSCEIWAQKINPEEAFNPIKNFPLVFTSDREPYRVGKIPIPTFGAKSVEIKLYNVALAGTLTIIQSDAPFHIWSEDTTRYIETQSINAGGNKFIIDNPSPYIALKTDVNMTEWEVILK
jgi:hypothetical protein